MRVDFVKRRQPLIVALGRFLQHDEIGRDAQQPIGGALELGIAALHIEGHDLEGGISRGFNRAVH